MEARSSQSEYRHSHAESWRVTHTVIGDQTQTHGRLAADLDKDEPVWLTYGDEKANVVITAQIAFHRAREKVPTLTAVTPPGYDGALPMRGERVEKWMKKPSADNTLAHGGFFILNPFVAARIAGVGP